MKKYLFYIIIVLLASCNDSQDSMSKKIGRINVLKSSEGELFFYRIVNGLSTNAYFLSRKGDFCKGFNKKEDYYYMVLDPVIYYKTNLDTLFVYTSLPADVPGNFGFNIVQIVIPSNESDLYEKMYAAHEINKVRIDSLYTPECEIVY